MPVEREPPGIDIHSAKPLGHQHTVSRWFDTHPKLHKSESCPVVHSVKSRLKNGDHLREKIMRKWDDANPIDDTTIFEKIPDIAGVRVLHLYQDQFPLIHREVVEKVDSLKDWVLSEPVKAYSWDPESKNFFQGLGIEVQIKESFYTSVHYLVRPRAGSPLCCEIQIRTLSEEIWGEVDHALNYPVATSNLA